MRLILSQLSITGLLWWAVLVSPLAAERIVIKGSDTLGARLIPILAEEFKAEHPGVSFEIAAEGSSTGIAAIINGNADIGMSSRNISDREKAEAVRRGVKIEQHIVAYDGVVVIVNAANPIADLSRRQLERVFAGQVADWAAVGGEPGFISVYARNTASGTHSDFKEIIMRRRDYSRNAQVLAGNEQIAAEVADNPMGIGYVGLIYAEAEGVKPVSIDGIAPSSFTSLPSAYPLSRPTYLYVRSKAEGELAEFIDFVLSRVGQSIVSREGFVAAK